MAKQKCKCPKPGLTAPFYMLTYGDMMTLLLTFFVLLFSMSSLQVVKFQAQVGVLQGSLGISEYWQHAPMQQHLPTPAVKESIRVVNHSMVKDEEDQPLSQNSSKSSNSMEQEEENVQRAAKALGLAGAVEVSPQDSEIIILLPTFGVFRKGEWTVDEDSPEVQRLKEPYNVLANEIANLYDYDIYFVGHTDSLPLNNPGDQLPRNNMELGFLRAVSLYEFFFEPSLPDRTRITFSSQGDNIPIVPNAKLDSERWKNRRVQIHLKRREGK